MRKILRTSRIRGHGEKAATRSIDAGDRAVHLRGKKSTAAMTQSTETRRRSALLDETPFVAYKGWRPRPGSNREPNV
jgi:hypothetical protein